MRNLSKVFKNKIFIFILGGLLLGSVGALAATYFPSKDVTYDNSSSGLSSTDVQGAIDELYKTCKSSEISISGLAGELLDKISIVTSGDGLYKDEYELRYFFKGANPNNYVTFNGEKAGWRILSIEYDGTIKIVKTIPTDYSIIWDTTSNNWGRPAALNTLLNESYYENELNETAHSQITGGVFSTGAIIFDNDLKQSIKSENSNKWFGNIALPTVSEFIRSCSNINQCGSTSLYLTNYYICDESNWLFDNTSWWTLTPRGQIYVYNIGTYSTISSVYPISDYHARYNVRPVLYISSDVKITGGNGTSSNPYTLG